MIKIPAIKKKSHGSKKFSWVWKKISRNNFFQVWKKIPGAKKFNSSKKILMSEKNLASEKIPGGLKNSLEYEKKISDVKKLSRI